MVILALSALSSKCHASNFSTAFAKTLAEIPFGADVASMGNASTATPAFSSRNPAIIAVEPEEKFTAGASTTYGLIDFNGGASVSVYSLSGTAKLPAGVMQVTLSNAGSNIGTTFDGFSKVQFNSSPSIDLQYGLPVVKNMLLHEDSIYLGASYSYSQSKITMTVDSNGFITNSEGHALGAGMLYRVAKILNLGISYEHSWDNADDSVDGIFDITTRSQSNKLRLGVGAQVTPSTFVAADYQHLNLSNGEKDDQYFAGIEQYVIKDSLAIYGGWANGGTTAGLGVYLKHGGVNVAYMHRPFRQMEEFLGKAEMLMASVYGTF